MSSDEDMLCLINSTEECFYLNNTSNETSKREDDYILPSEYTVISPEQWRSIILYAIIFTVASTGNIAVLISVCGHLRESPSSMNKLLLHLAIADLMVVFIVIPSEIGWRFSIAWNAGNILCKLLQYLRAFGLYLSSLLLICISLDRYYVVVDPMSTIRYSSKRVRMWIILSWCSAAICSFPQVIVFQEIFHPVFSTYRQCMSKDEFVAIHTSFFLIVVYFLPLSAIIFSYTKIILTIQSHSTPSEGQESSIVLRRSSRCFMKRARKRTLKLTFVIVVVFFICWTPYVIITLWHMLDRPSAESLNSELQDFLFTMVVANSSANPLVYLFFTRKSSSSRSEAVRTASTTVRSRLSSIITHNAIELRPL